jgi:hypothetical protein
MAAPQPDLEPIREDSESGRHVGFMVSGARRALQRRQQRLHLFDTWLMLFEFCGA